MLRYVKPGDVFCFKVDGGMYRFGRIMSLMSVGHIAEIFDILSDTPKITEGEIENAKRIISPLIIDTYSLLDKKIEPESDWRIIGHQDNYSPIMLMMFILHSVLVTLAKRKILRECFSNRRKRME